MTVAFRLQTSQLSKFDRETHGYGPVLTVKYLTSNLMVNSLYCNLIFLSHRKVFLHGICFKFLLKYKLIATCALTRIIVFMGT